MNHLQCATAGVSRPFLLVVLFAVAFAASPSSARGQTTLDCFDNTSATCQDSGAHALPTSVDEFKKLRAAIGDTPEGGATLFVHALMVWTQNQDLGRKLLILATSEEELRRGDTGSFCVSGRCYELPNEFEYHLKQIAQHEYCIWAHAVGATAANQYRIPDAKKVSLRFRDQKIRQPAKGKKVFVCSNAASTCRPVHVVANRNGLYKAAGFPSSLSVGCAKLEETDQAVDDL